MKATTLRERSADELAKNLSDLEEQLFKLRFQKSTGQIELMPLFFPTCPLQQLQMIVQMFRLAGRELEPTSQLKHHCLLFWIWARGA